MVVKDAEATIQILNHVAIRVVAVVDACMSILEVVNVWKTGSDGITYAHQLVPRIAVRQVIDGSIVGTRSADGQALPLEGQDISVQVVGVAAAVFAVVRPMGAGILRPMLRLLQAIQSIIAVAIAHDIARPWNLPFHTRDIAIVLGSSTAVKLGEAVLIVQTHTEKIHRRIVVQHRLNLSLIGFDDCFDCIGFVMIISYKASLGMD